MKSEKLFFREILKFSQPRQPWNLRTGRNMSTALSPQEGVKEDEKFVASVKTRKTALFDVHAMHGGKMTDFCGYSLPLQYEGVSIKDSHLHTRSKCSLFDVSHMMQTTVKGKAAVPFVESLCVSDISGMKKNACTLSLFLNAGGGIIDDLIVTKVSDEELYLVSNASRKNVDQRLILDKMREFPSVSVNFLDSDEQSLLAIQGPKTVRVLQPFINADLTVLRFMRSVEVAICGVPCRVTRCGYTGEDGVEISLPSREADKIVNLLMDADQDVRLAGLGARDTLRLEAGMCLYGNDIDENTTPVEAGLLWTIGRSRRKRCDFPGADAVMDQLKRAPRKKRVGVLSEKGPVPRPGTKLTDDGERVVGYVTSGCQSPSLSANIAMAYVDESLKNDVISLLIRGKSREGRVVKMPFVRTNYFNPK